MGGRNLAREEREPELDLRALRQQSRTDPFRRPYSDEELDRMIDERSTEHARKNLEEKFEELAQHITPGTPSLWRSPGTPST